MAVARATLPLKSRAEDDEARVLAASTGAGADLEDAAFTGVDFTGAAFAGAALAGAALAGAAGLLATLAAGFGTGLAATGTFFGAAGGAFLAGALLIAVFFTATFFTGTFLAGAFLAGAFETTFLAGAFFAAGFAAAFLAGATFLAGAFAAAFLTGLATLRAAGLADDFFAADLAAGFAGVLLALFTVRPFVAATVDLPVLRSFALAEDLPF